MVDLKADNTGLLEKAQHTARPSLLLRNPVPIVACCRRNSSPSELALTVLLLSPKNEGIKTIYLGVYFIFT